MLDGSEPARRAYDLGLHLLSGDKEALKADLAKAGGTEDDPVKKALASLPDEVKKQIEPLQKKKRRGMGGDEVVEHRLAGIVGTLDDDVRRLVDEDQGFVFVEDVDHESSRL